MTIKFYKIIFSLFFFMSSIVLASDDMIISDGGIIVGGSKANDSAYKIEGHFINYNNSTMTDSTYYVYRKTNDSKNFKFATNFQLIDTISTDSLQIFYNTTGIYSELTGYFHYRLSGQQNYDSVIAIQNNHEWKFNIPSEAVTIRGLEYYVEVKSPTKIIQQGNNKNPLMLITSFPDELGRANFEIVPNKYSLIGFPVTTNKNQAQDFFENNFEEYDPLRWRVGHYDNNLKKYIEYNNLQTITPGIGLWLISDRKKEFSIAGYSVMPNYTTENMSYYKITLDSGWNQIANPFAFDIDWNQILFESSELFPEIPPYVEPVGYLFNGNNFFPASIVPAWHGLFIFSYKNNVSMLFPSEEATQAYQAKKTNSNNNGNIQIELISKNQTDSDNFIGLSDNAKDGLDEFDRHQPPSPSGLISLYFMKNGEKLSKDIRNPDSDLEQFDLHINTVYNSYLKFTGLNQFEYKNLTIMIKINNQIIRLLNDTTINSNKNIERATIYIGPKDKVEQKLLTTPDEFNLTQNYPNPFNNSTSITFSLPNQSDVKIEIYNSLGRKVKTLLDSKYEAGTYQIIWDGTNNQNKKVATGIYFTKLITSQSKKSIKMLLIK